MEHSYSVMSKPRLHCRLELFPLGITSNISSNGDYWARWVLARVIQITGQHCEPPSFPHTGGQKAVKPERRDSPQRGNHTPWQRYGKCNIVKEIQALFL